MIVLICASTLANLSTPMRALMAPRCETVVAVAPAELDRWADEFAERHPRHALRADDLLVELLLNCTDAPLGNRAPRNTEAGAFNRAVTRVTKWDPGG